jgi:hypothetical protein
MTTAPEDDPPTLLHLLFGSEEEAVRALAGELAAPGGNQALDHALAALPEATRKAAGQAVAKAGAGLLKIDPAGVLVNGWRDHQKFIAAARQTLAAPGSTELVTVSEQEITLHQDPSVRVLVNDSHVATVQFDLSVVLAVKALVLGVSGGTISAVHSGSCDITVALAVQGTEMISRRAHLDLPGNKSLRRGWRLLPATEYPAGGAPPAE